jgi:hypothetical protein
MRSLARFIVIATALALPLGGCASVDFDPLDWFAGDWFGSKGPLPGERKPVFPEGVPGVTRGMPTEYLSETQRAEQLAREQQAAATEEAVEEKPEPKPKPKAKAKPKPKPKPTVAAQQPEQQEPAPAPRQPAQGQVQWPDPPPAQRQPASPQIQWPDPPPPR